MKQNASKRGDWNIHPGEILREEFLKPMKLSVYRLAKELRVPVPRVNDIVLEKRGISAETAIRLARFFGTSEQFWMNLQSSYEIRKRNQSCGVSCRRSGRKLPRSLESARRPIGPLVEKAPPLLN
jgi:antitoxin HigA-1